MVLATLPGIGERLIKRLDEHFGGRDEVMRTLQSGDISRIAEVEGISVKRALQLARQVHQQGKVRQIQQVVEETRWPPTTIKRKKKIDRGYRTQKVSPQ